MHAPPKPSFLRNLLVRILLLSLFILVVRFAYVVTIRGESCDISDFCFFSDSLNFASAGAGTRAASAVVVAQHAVPGKVGDVNRELLTSKDWVEAVRFHSAVFQDLMAEGYLKPDSKSLCIETPTGHDVFGLKEIGVFDSIGISKKSFKPLVVSGLPHRLPFEDDTFDFIFSGGGGLDRSSQQLGVASEVSRTLKPGGVFMVHTNSTDEYSFNSFIALFNCCRVARVREIEGLEASMPRIHEIVMIKELKNSDERIDNGLEGTSKCPVPGYKQKLVRDAEPLIEEEPLKPWLTFKRNIKNVKYLPTMADINFKSRYVYVDVGARSYGSSIGSWFRKQYPKQNKTFEVYAIEADKAFHAEYELKKNVKLLPYAAWVRNETLVFEVNRDPGQDKDAKGRGMGRIKPVVESGHGLASDVNEIQGFDFANWLKSTVTEKDFVVMKMDVEGTEFDLIPRLFETGAICLVDEVFLECHYNRWQKCCPGERSPKYEKTYDQCLELFTSLRQSGVLVHQWW
uniref:Methyltransferase n=1 Tax=Kalanchoe fedtschenkoi TaxID=63787 RepID=A0A7N0T6E5_KALFE